MIEAKTLFTDWHEITEEQAIDYALHLFMRSNCDDRVGLVNKRIRGIKFTTEELYARADRRRKKNIESISEGITNIKNS